jgi:hypothetical protein
MDSALIVDAFVLAAVLESDLGHRKVTTFRLVRPVLIALAIVPLFLTAVTTHGHGLVLEVALAAAGILVGLLAMALMTVYRSPTTGGPVSRAGAAYAALWIVVVGARAAFTYGSHHWFASQLGHWMVRNAITGDAITDGLIFMAVTMVLTRTIALSIRARRLPAATSTDTGPELRAA